jgi:hypothetical protein
MGLATIIYNIGSKAYNSKQKIETNGLYRHRTEMGQSKKKEMKIRNILI